MSVTLKATGKKIVHNLLKSYNCQIRLSQRKHLISRRLSVLSGSLAIDRSPLFSPMISPIFIIFNLLLSYFQWQFSNPKRTSYSILFSWAGLILLGWLDSADPIPSRISYWLQEKKLLLRCLFIVFVCLSICFIFDKVETRF